MFPAFRSNRLCIRLWRLVGEGGCGGLTEVLNGRLRATRGREARGCTRSGILGAVKRGEPVPASMKDLIYIHRRKTRKTVYQKSYRAGSDRGANEQERKDRERETQDARERKKEGFTTAEMKLSVHGLPPTSLCPRISALPLPSPFARSLLRLHVQSSKLQRLFPKYGTW